jgi:hypothetical protein
LSVPEDHEKGDENRDCKGSSLHVFLSFKPLPGKRGNLGFPTLSVLRERLPAYAAITTRE